MQQGLKSRIRLVDIFLSLFLLVSLSPVFLFVGCGAWLNSGPIIYKQRRVGNNGRPFVIYKFRTMKVGTPELSTHHVDSSYITGFGRFLRCYKLDELPQLVNVVKGEMSLVGPRPCLLSQNEVLELRQKFNLMDFKPGITGLAQIYNVNMSTPRKMVRLEARMMRNFSRRYYLKLLILTAFRNR
jgi:O-antigen biosynthesis protein WbqP